MKIVFIGSVSSSEVALKELINSDTDIEMVFSLDESVSENVSGYRPLHELAEENNIPYKKFIKINDKENIRILHEIVPDYIFVIGLSQILSKELLSTAKLGVIGFHPTPLPKFRGRAAMVWQVLLGIHNTKCTMFFIDEGMDSGDIIAQESYVIGDNDYAEDIEKNLLSAIASLTCRVIHMIKSGNVTAIKQNEAEATYLLKRSPEDGIIDWNMDIHEIYNLIRAVSKPYPGAFSFYDRQHKIIIWRAEIRENNKYIGFPGQIAKLGDNTMDIVCRNGLLHVTEYENIDDKRLFVGHRFGNK